MCPPHNKGENNMALTKNKSNLIDLTKVGVLFSKESKGGKTYFTGFLESGLKLVAFVSDGVNKETGETMTVLNIYEQNELDTNKKDGIVIKKAKNKINKLPF